MAVPPLSPGQLEQVSSQVANYIQAQRQNYVTRATALPPTLRLVVNPFFRPDVLNTARVAVLESERVGNPDFYPMLEGLGFTNSPNFAGMAAITFNDVIVSHEALTPSLLFHELVHVEQYRQLGLDRFAELYVKGFLEGGCYEEIPLELNAYGLEGGFQKSPHRAFSVEEEVAAWLREEDEDRMGFGG